MTTMNLGNIKNRIAGTLGIDDGGEAAVDELFATAIHYIKAVDGATGTTTAVKVAHNPNPYPMRILRASYSPGTTLTSNASNYATLAIETDDGADGTPVACLSQTTQTSGGGGSGNFVADTEVPLSDTTAAALDVVAGGNVFFTIAKAADGVVVPAGTLTVVWTPTGSD